ncbi:hypothetical protein T12_11906, partial [Trichinella patagoniensis]
LEVAGWKKSSTERHILIILGQLLIIEVPAKHQQHLGRAEINGDRYWSAFHYLHPLPGNKLARGLCVFIMLFSWLYSTFI